MDIPFNDENPIEEGATFTNLVEPVENKDVEYTPENSSEPESSIQERIQKSLQQSEHYTGPVNGAFGRRSIIAIQDVVLYDGATPGVIDQETLDLISEFVAEADLDQKTTLWNDFAIALEQR